MNSDSLNIVIERTYNVIEASTVMIYSELILGLRPANERRNAVSHWLGAKSRISPDIGRITTKRKMGKIHLTLI